MGLKNTCQGVRCTLPRVTTGIRNIAPNQSRLIRLSEPCNKKNQSRPLGKSEGSDFYGSPK